MKPTGATTRFEPLVFEGTIQSHLLSAQLWSRTWSDWQRQSFSRMSEDLGLVLLEASLNRDDTLNPSLGQAG